MRTLHYLKKIEKNFGHENRKKQTSKLAYLWQFGFFFLSAAPTALNDRGTVGSLAKIGFVLKRKQTLRINPAMSQTLTEKQKYAPGIGAFFFVFLPKLKTVQNSFKKTISVFKKKILS